MTNADTYGSLQRVSTLEQQMLVGDCYSHSDPAAAIKSVSGENSVKMRLKDD